MTEQQTMTDQQSRAWSALSRAASRVGADAHREQLAAHLKRGRARSTYRYFPTEGHRELVSTLAELGRGRITAEEAMAALHYGEGAASLERARNR